MVLLGPRQVGKTTLAMALAGDTNGRYLDLESPSDLAKLAEPEMYLRDHQDELVILDEVHLAPGLFPVLRGLIDGARRADRRRGQYLLLGSASLKLLRQSGETLAGRVSYLELGPLDVMEVEGREASADRLWVRGGFPDSFLAASDQESLRWRQDFIRTYLERDIPQLGPRIAAETLRRLWVMLAHHQGGLLNVSQLARNLGISGKVTAGYIDLLVDLLLVRRLQPWHTNTGKRLTRSPKLYLRDSGVVHALLGIPDKEALLSHPVIGMSWEGYVIETLMAVVSQEVEAFFYRTAIGAEIDLLLRFPDGSLWAIEVKRSLSPRPARGFHSAGQDVNPTEKFLVYPGDEAFPVKEDVLAIPLADLAARLIAKEAAP